MVDTSGYSFFVPGVPATAGSKRAFPYRKAAGGLGVRVTHDNPQTTSWMSVVRHFAHEEIAGRGPIEGPVLLGVTFHLARPKGHFGTGKNSRVIKDSAPKYPTSKPDLTKLVRCVEDALRGLAWKDDSQVVMQITHKEYASVHGEIGAAVVIKPMSIDT